MWHLPGASCVNQLVVMWLRGDAAGGDTAGGDVAGGVGARWGCVHVIITSYYYPGILLLYKESY